MQYSGNPQQQRFLNMMMQARQQEAAMRQQSAAAAAASLYSPAGVGVGVGVGAGLSPHHPLQQRGLPLQHSSLHQHLQQQQQQQQQRELLFVTRLTDNDVLLGRGTPCAENEGNVRFRRLVKQRKLEYIAAEKRMRKDAIAREVLEVVASRGGKFLRKVESKSEMAALGVPASIIQAKGGSSAGPGNSSNEVWVIVDEETQVQKVKQALRNKDDTGDLPPPRSSSPSSSQQQSQQPQDSSSHSRAPYMERNVTNRFPRGVVDESNIHRAESNIKFGAGGGVLERASSGSSGEEGDEAKLSSPKLSSASKKHKKKGILLDSPTKAKETSYRSGSLGLGGLREMPETATMGLTTSPGGAGRADLLGGLDAQRFPGGAGPGLNPVLCRRQMWDRSQAAASDGELRTFQELQRLRMMREQMGMPMTGPGSPDFMGNPALAAAGAGLDATATMGAGFYGAASVGGLMTAEYRQMQAQQLHAQQLQAQRMAAAREQAATVASLRGAGPVVHPSAALAARQLQLESHTAGMRRGSSASALRGLSHQVKAKAALDAPGASSSSSSRATEPAARGRAGADSAGERAIGIAQAMKRADAFSSTESLELSHIETLILSVLCSHGLPVWTPESNTKAFISLPAFTTKDADWNWCDFAMALNEKASDSEWKDNKHIDDQVVELAMESATEYLAAARELAIKSIMLMEKLRRHSSAAGGGATQRKQWSGLGMRVPLWLDRELSKWAMILDIADPTGRPVPFSSSDFVADHPGYKENPSIVATATFDPQLADDVVDQVALLTRLRSIFVKSKSRDVRAKVEAAVKKAGAVGEGWEDQPKGWDPSEEDGSAVSREVLLCDRLLKSGFTGVLTSVSELSPSYTGAASSKTRPCPSFESLGLTKSAIQQRVNQITRELHILDESKDMQDLLGDRMERIAQSVLKAQEDGDEPSRRDAVARLLGGAPSPGEGTKKRRASYDGSVASQSKKQKSDD